MEALEAALLTEPTPDFDDLVTLVAGATAQDEWSVRQALLRIRQLEAEANRVGEMADAITTRYAERIANLTKQRDQLRASVQTYLERVNGGESISFPDAGTAYLTTQKPKVNVVDPAAFEDWASRAGLTKTVPNTAAAKKTATDYALRGELVPGVDFVPERKALALRKAA